MKRREGERPYADQTAPLFLQHGLGTGGPGGDAGGEQRRHPRHRPALPAPGGGDVPGPAPRPPARGGHPLDSAGRGHDGAGGLLRSGTPRRPGPAQALDGDYDPLAVPQRRGRHRGDPPAEHPVHPVSAEKAAPAGGRPGPGRRAH